MKTRLIAFVVSICLVAKSTGQNPSKDPNDFFEGIRQGKLSIEGRDTYTILNTTMAGGDFPRKAYLVNITADQVTLIDRVRIVIPKSKIRAIIRIEGPGK